MAQQSLQDDFIEDVLSRTDLVAVISARIPLKRSGKNFSACCPFHKEKNPSFTVSPDKQFYYCFGCGAHGNAISFLRDYEHKHFVDAVTLLAQAAGLVLPTHTASAKEQGKQGSRHLYEMLQRAQLYYSGQLFNEKTVQPRARQYLKKRQITSQIAKEFGLGYAPEGWDNLKTVLVHSNKELSDALEAGLLVQKDERFYDRFRDRLMFPIRDLRGRTIAFGGRVLGDDKPKYLNSPESPLFQKSAELYGLYELLQSRQKLKKILIVEGYIDVIALAQHHIRFAVATLGTATSTNHVERLFRYVPELVFCFDGDQAGRKAAERALEIVIPSLRDGRQVRFLFLPDGEDPDSLIRKEGHELFNARLDKAQPISDFLFAHLGEGLDLSAMDSRARLASLALPVLHKIPGSFLQELLLDQLATLTRIDSRTLKIQLQLLSQSEQNLAESRSATPASRAPLQERRFVAKNRIPSQEGVLSAEAEQSCALTYKIIRLLLQLPQQAQLLAMPDELKEVALPHIKLLLDILAAFKKAPAMSTAALLGYWHDSQEGRVLAGLAAQEFLLSDNHAELEINEAMLQLRKLHISKLIQDQIALDRQTGSKDGSRLRDLLELKKTLYLRNTEDDSRLLEN
ncbi:MAG TPA: DNA primase [Pseudomonadales bacterium]|nr:DNA primase [Pseudomonadales bacterium]